MNEELMNEINDLKASLFDANAALIKATKTFEECTDKYNSLIEKLVDSNVMEESVELEDEDEDIITADDVPMTEAVAEEPVAEETTEEAVVEEPVAEETTEEAVVEEPVAEETTEEAVAEEPVAEETTEVVAEEPVAEETTEVVAEEPAEENTEVVAEEPAAEETTEVVAEEPVAEETTEAVAEPPVVSETQVNIVSKDEVKEEDKDNSTSIVLPVLNDTVITIEDKVKYKKTSTDPTKALLVNPKQGSNLRASKDTQKALMNGTSQDTNTAVPKEQQIEGMLDEAKKLYEEGKVAEAEALTNQVSDLNKELVKAA